MSKSVIDQLAEDTAPKNFSEFELGLTLLAIYNEMNQELGDFNPEAYDNMMDKIPEALEYWRKKYGPELEALKSDLGQSAGDGQ